MRVGAWRGLGEVSMIVIVLLLKLLRRLTGEPVSVWK